MAPRILEASRAPALDEVIPEKSLLRWYAVNEATLEYGGSLHFLIRCDTVGKGYIVSEHLNVLLRAKVGTVTIVLSAGYYDSTHT